MQTTEPDQRSRWLAPLAYLLMTAIAICGYFLIREFGEQIVPPGGVIETKGAAAAPGPSPHAVLLHVLIALSAVILVGRILATAFRYLGQPPVIGEVLAGILLGPSALGAIWPAGADFVLPANVAPVLGVIAQLGVVLYMFCVGLELDSELLRRHGPATVAISHASIVAPFLLGAVVSLWLYPRYAPSQVSFTVFSLFLGAAMSVTAFPVLARILTDRGAANTPLGVVALTCAAADDATAWCLLAIVVGVAQADLSRATAVIVLTLVFVAAMIVIVRPLLRMWVNRSEEHPTQAATATVLLLVILSALTTEAIGIHAIFGGFLLGAIFPTSDRLSHEVRERIMPLVSTLLLPAFFAFTGMRTQLGLVSGWENWLWCAVIIAVATLGKLGGSAIAARLAGASWHEATSLGILMNTRGLMELIVLNIGLDLGVISPTIFAMMVIMALVTTLATTPVLHLLGTLPESSALNPSPTTAKIGE